jgi:hypothetical protein
MIQEDLTPQQYAEKVNPARSTRFEIIPGTSAMAFIMEGIPLAKDTAKYLFAENDEGQEHTFDYANLATDEGKEKYSQRLLKRQEERIPFTKDKESIQITQLNLELLNFFDDDSPDQMKMLEQFFKTIRQHPDKPFLIVRGHGGTLDSKWVMGEKRGKNYTEVDTVTKHFSSQKEYSAILLISCNPKNERVTPIEGTSIFFVDGLSGVGQERVVQVAAA